MTWHGNTPGHKKAADKAVAIRGTAGIMKSTMIKQAKVGFEVGEMLYGFCNGYFGRDSYEDKRVVAAGVDWIVCRDEDGNIHFATFDINKPIATRLPTRNENDYISFWEMVKKWRVPEGEQ